MQLSDFDQLLKSLRRPEVYPHPVSGVRVIQTHISAVLLTGEYAYKLKKPLNMGFLDFSTLARRKHFCEEEIRLNRRLAPHLYLDTIAITGTPEAPVMGGEGTPIEYLVRMRQFDTDQQLDRLLARGELSAKQIDTLVSRIAAFHAEAQPVDPDSPLGTPEAVFEPMQQNFDQLYPLMTDPVRRAQLEKLEKWTRTQFERLAPLLAERRAAGFIRECHGDMHLGNMALVDQEMVIFDGIEFNEAFRWIDVANEIAFFVMDLESRGATALAHRVLNAWVECTGDHQALTLMRFYQTYRAMVRAKVASIRLGQSGLTEDEQTEILADYQRYANLAEHYTANHPVALLITHGYSGSGKTTLSTQAVEGLGMIRVRSDVERKRLHALDTEAHSHSGIKSGLYTDLATEQTYTTLKGLAKGVLENGFPVVVDASFLARNQREQFASLASSLQVPYLILDVQADETTLIHRINQRKNDASEATTDVLRWQMEHADALDPTEPRMEIESTQILPLERLRSQLKL